MYLMKNFLVLFLSLFANYIYAQRAENYAFSTNTTADLVDMTASKLLIESNKSLTSSSVEPIGFEFWFMGERYTDFSVNSNGVLRLGKTPLIPLGNSYNIANNSRLVAFSALDLNGNTNERIGTWATSNTGKVHYKVLDVPEKVLVVEWKDLNINYKSTTADATFQLLVYAYGKIEFRYGQMKSNLDLSNVVIGIGSGEKFDQFKAVNFAGFPTAITSTTTVSNPIEKGEIQKLSSSTAKQRRFFLFEPPKPTLSAKNLKICPQNNELKLSWEIQNGTQNFLYSVIYKSENGKEFEYLTKTKETSFIDQKVSLGNTYSYKIHLVSEGVLSDLDNSVKKEIRFLPPQKLDLGADIQVCIGETFSLQAQEGFSSYLWSNSATGSKISLQATQNQDIILLATQGDCLQFSDTVAIKVSQKPIFVVEGNKNICDGTFTELSVRPQDGKEYEYYWVSPTKKKIIAKNLQISELGTWQLSVSDPEGCAVSQNIRITNCCEAQVEIPNAFTPFRSSANNVFKISQKGLFSVNVQIYNRWGELVFASTALDFEWDGTKNGKNCAVDVYQVILEYTTCRGEKVAKIQKSQALYIID